MRSCKYVFANLWTFTTDLMNYSIMMNTFAHHRSSWRSLTTNDVSDCRMIMFGITHDRTTSPVSPMKNTWRGDRSFAQRR